MGLSIRQWLLMCFLCENEVSLLDDILLAVQINWFTSLIPPLLRSFTVTAAVRFLPETRGEADIAAGSRMLFSSPSVTSPDSCLEYPESCLLQLNAHLYE